jgi:hypothetical protein
LCGVTGRDKLYYLFGVLLLLASVFIDKDLSDAGELLEGAVMFVALLIMFLFALYIRGRGGTGFYVPGL